MAASGTVRTLYNFPGGGSGCYPAAALALAADGNYYGTTTKGGDSSLNAGVVYRVTPAGRWTLVHAFGPG